MKVRGRPASRSKSLQLGEKDAHISGRSRSFMKYAGQVRFWAPIDGEKGLIP
jgi:hypothetical protein